MSSYNIIFKKQIHASQSASDSDDIYLQKRCRLPFVPQSKMTITVGDLDIELYDPNLLRQSDKEAQIVYDMGQDEFTIYCPPDEELYYNNDSNPRTVQEIADEYVEAGWDLEDTEDA